MNAENSIWIFNGPTGRFPSAVFANRGDAETWIARNRLTGTLTAYPLGAGAYDWAVGKGYFKPKQDRQRAPEFIQNFSSASQEHYHYENGENAEEEDEDPEDASQFDDQCEAKGGDSHTNSER